MNTQTPNQKESFTLRHLLQEQSRDLYDAEKAYSEFLGRMIRVANDERLKEEMELIATNVMENISDLEEICAMLEISPAGIKCEAMAGLLREAKETTSEYESGSVCDAALIANAQRIAHYEIAGCGTAHAFASKLNLAQVASLFSDITSRAGAADRALTKIAKGSWMSDGVNHFAVFGN
ncbi:DUF892 family protein [Luteolibacter algae]|uniref:DUF892 family protein n=1 Tax=Luteolibacter algae TaxID=454151 RepID=A0ABW5DBW6_9BACT